MTLRLVVDTSIIFAAILRDSTTRRILLSAPIEFFAPEYCFEEIREHLDEICKRNGLPVEVNMEIIQILRRHIHMIRWNDLLTSLEDAERIMANIDPDDSIFLAATLAIHCDGLWTEDLHFQEQSAIRVWRTKDLVHFIR